MTILQELWAGHHIHEDAKTTSGYVVKQRKRLEDTYRLAKDEHQNTKLVQKKHYDQKTRPRHLAVADKVLPLLSSDKNKVVLTWKGPFTVLERRNDVDYTIDLGTRTTLLHENPVKIMRNAHLYHRHYRKRQLLIRLMTPKMTVDHAYNFKEMNRRPTSVYRNRSLMTSALKSRAY